MKVNIIEKHRRWGKAQKYEKAWWENNISSLDLNYCKDYALQIVSFCNDCLQITKSTKILEIGSGPAGVLTFLDTDFRFALDPLELMFSKIENCRNIRDINVSYLVAKSENIPFPTGYFDLVIIDNVLDHCENYEMVLSEISRTIKSGGIVYMRVNFFDLWGKLIRSFAEFYKIDEGHPHTFTKGLLWRQVEKAGLKVVKYEETNYFKQWAKQFVSKKIKQIIASILLVIQRTVVLILKK